MPGRGDHRATPPRGESRRVARPGVRVAGPPGRALRPAARAHRPRPPDPEPEPGRPLAFPAELLDALRDVDLRPLAPKAVLHVHLHEAALHGSEAVARVEGFGPVTLTRLTELLRRFDVRVQPVKDLSDRVRYTAYEHPESLRDQVHLIAGGDYWPYATSTSRNVDLDHPTPYQHGTDRGTGREPPPDQTGSHNSGPLGRRHHRWKTHAGYQSRQCGEGTLHLAHTPRARVPRRPHRHPPHPPRKGTDDLRSPARGGHLPALGDPPPASSRRRGIDAACSPDQG